MIFFERFVKKVEDREKTFIVKEKYSYFLKASKIFLNLSTTIPLVLIGLLQGYNGVLAINGEIEKSYLVYFVTALLAISLGIYNMRGLFTFKVKLNLKEDYILHGKIKINFSDIKTITLTEMVPGNSKKMLRCIDIVTDKKEQFIIPLIMNNSLEFVVVLKKVFTDKFKIKSV